MHEYNTGRNQLFLKEYGRNIQKVVAQISTIEDKAIRTKQAQAILKLMDSLSAGGKNNIEYPQKRWDDLFIIADYSLDIESNYPMPTRDVPIKQPERLAYLKGPIKYRHYGRHIEALVQKAAQVTVPLEQEQMIVSIARLIKNFSNNWNKDNLDMSMILTTIQAMAGGKLVADLEKIKVALSFYTPYTGHKDKNKPYKRVVRAPLTQKTK